MLMLITGRGCCEGPVNTYPAPGAQQLSGQQAGAVQCQVVQGRAMSMVERNTMQCNMNARKCNEVNIWGDVSSPLKMQSTVLIQVNRSVFAMKCVGKVYPIDMVLVHNMNVSS